MIKHIRTVCVIALVGVSVAITLRAALLQQPHIATSESPRAQLFQFGVIGDGVADDTAAIQRAIDSGLGEIVLPKGIYRITQPLAIDLDKVGYTSFHGNGVARIEMRGAGPAIKFAGTHFKSADPGGYGEDVWDRQRMPIVDGIAIVGKHPEASGIAAIGTMQLTVTRTHIRHVMHGIHLLENNRNVIVADSHIYENRGVGIFYDNVNLHQSNITNCHISYNAMGGVVSRAGNVRNIHISGCDIESNMSPETPATANVLIDCSGSAYGTGEVAITGCTIQHNNPSPDSANIRMIGRSTASRDQSLVREGNVTITGNVLSDVQVNLHLKDCRGVAITGNTFWQGYSHNLLVEDCSNIVVGPNNFDRNPRYDYGNTKEANNGLVFRNSVDCTLTGLHITNVWRSPAGLQIANVDRFSITNCTILDCDAGGLLLENARNSRVSDCLIRDDRAESAGFSIHVVGGEGNQIVDNLLGTPISQID
ncbi:MAG: right-handed parallel beta-helix repeat-containing protein [Planctomycetaceae bacterium]|nr:right-handed parallel beta-helix repeat-containing protein [Planctomycetaceae bacterium]